MNPRTRSAPQTLPSLSVCEVIREERAVSWHGCGASKLCPVTSEPTRSDGQGSQGLRGASRSSLRGGRVVPAIRDIDFMDRNARADGQPRSRAVGTPRRMNGIRGRCNTRTAKPETTAPARSALFHTVRGRYRAED